MHIARIADVDLPMLNGVIRSNESHLRSATRRVLDSGERAVALLGLSFKPETDDLRESPYVELAELLGGKGLESGSSTRSSSRRACSGQPPVRREHLPHLQRMLCSSPGGGSSGRGRRGRRDVRRRCRSEAVLDAPPRFVLDLHGSVSPELEALPGYSGIAW